MKTQNFSRVIVCAIMITIWIASCNFKSKSEPGLGPEPEPENVSQAYTCDFQTALIIGSLHVLSSPIMDQSKIKEFVFEYSDLLDENSNVMRCMRRLGQLLSNQGKQNFNFNDADNNRVRESVMNMCNGTGFEGQSGELADKIAGSMRQEAVQPILVGQELIWLANVIPDAADDDWDSYENTGSWFRQEAKQQAAVSKEVLDRYGRLDPDINNILGSVMPLMDQWNIQYGIEYIIMCGIYLGVFQ